MPDVAINAQAVIAAGQGYLVPDSLEIVLKAVRASFDGTGAGGSFVPMLQIVAPGGLVAAECPVGSTIAAGASADVSWFPHIAGQTSGGASNAVLYDTSPQGAGHYLYSTTDAAGPNGYGTRILDNGTFGMLLETTGAGNLIVECDNGDLSIAADAGDINIGNGSGLLSIVNNVGGSGISIDNNSGSATLITADGTGARMELRSNTDILMTLGFVGSPNLTIENLPTAPPVGSNHVWNNGGVLTIT